MASHPDKITEYFDSHAETYDEGGASVRWMGGEMLRVILRSHPIVSVHSMLDLAAGTGNATKVVEEFVRPRHITTVDGSQGMLDQLAEKYNHDPRISLVHRAVGAFVAESNKQHDLVVCVAGFPFMEDQLQVITDTGRLVKPGGPFVFTYDSHVYFHSEQAERTVSFPLGLAVYRQSPGEIDKAVQAGGLEVIENLQFIARDKQEGERDPPISGIVMAQKPKL